MGTVSRRVAAATAVVVLVITSGCTGGRDVPPEPTAGTVRAADFVQPTDPWQDGDFSVPGPLERATGIGAMITACSSGAAKPLELRLDSRFRAMTISVSQGRATKTTATTLAVDVEDNYQRLMTPIRVRYGETARLVNQNTVDVTGVAVLDLKVYVEAGGATSDPDDDCSEDTQVFAVLSDLKLVAAT